jgi:hypothetical protein
MIRMPVSGSRGRRSMCKNAFNLYITSIMSSVLASFAQRLTRSFVITQDANQGENGAYLFPDDAVDVWYTANAANIKKVGSVYTIAGTGNNNFVGVVDGEGSNARLGGSNPVRVTLVSDRKNLRDMGKEVIIGTPAEPRLLVLRRIQRYTDAANANSATDPTYTGYVVIENNAEDLGGNAGRFTVRVARI